MRDDALHTLIRLNNAFYRDNHASFSASRTQGWNGWNRVLAHMEPVIEGCRILDLACGNLRFERFALEAFPHAGIEFTGIDSCAEMSRPPLDGVRFVQEDVIARLIDKMPLAQGGFDAAVSFGFMHHVPTFGLRASLLESLIDQVRPNGLVAVSFWKFADDRHLAARAAATTETGCEKLGLELDEGDYLLGWNNQAGAYRYCHSFTDDEIARLIDTAESRAAVVDRFDSDGRNGALNGYAIIRLR